MTLFCCATHHPPHKLFSATRPQIELKFSQQAHLNKTRWFQDKSGTLSSTDPTSYLEDMLVLDKVPDVQLSSNFHSRLTWPRVNDFRTNQEHFPPQIQLFTCRTGYFLDKVPDVQFSSNFPSRLTWPRLNDFRTIQNPCLPQIHPFTCRTGLVFT